MCKKPTSSSQEIHETLDELNKQKVRHSEYAQLDSANSSSVDPHYDHQPLLYYILQANLRYRSTYQSLQRENMSGLSCVDIC